MDDTLKANDGEESTGDGSGGNGNEDDYAQQPSSVAATLALEEEARCWALRLEGHDRVRLAERTAGKKERKTQRGASHAGLKVDPAARNGVGTLDEQSSSQCLE